jgi:hypothetical protein
MLMRWDYLLVYAPAETREQKMEPVTISAHFDGKQILLDEPFALQPNTKLIVTVLPEISDDDEERRDFLALSRQGFERAFGDDEPEYPLSLLKEINPHYEAR